MLLFKAIRIHQWVKNLLLFVPFLLAFRQVEPGRFLELVQAFAAFSFLASASYLVNDIVDLESDRQHPGKSRRPLASGAITVKQAGVLAIVLLAGAILLAWSQPWEFQIVLAIYLLLTLAYSFIFKSIAVMDVLVLAGLYTVRIIAGIFAAGVEVSYWILVFSMFFFLSLAMVKRYSELYNLRQRDEDTVHGRSYQASDIEFVATLGGASGYIGVLIIVLYIHDPLIAAKYTDPFWLWAIFPAMLYWISRIWLIAHRGEMNEDPVLYAIHDVPSYLVGAVCLAGFWLAI